MVNPFLSKKTRILVRTQGSEGEQQQNKNGKLYQNLPFVDFIMQSANKQIFCLEDSQGNPRSKLKSQQQKQ